jgi:hypothetical protein
LNKKKFSNYLTLTGILLTIVGTIFILQSNSIIGPSASFMYKNPEWATNGFIISTIGIIVAILSILYGSSNNNRI